MTPIKNFREAAAETLTGLALLLLFGFFLLGDISGPLTVMFAGLVLLASGYYQKQRGWQVSLFTWGLGIVLAVGGLVVRLFLAATLELNWVLVGLVVIGIYTGVMVARFMPRKTENPPPTA